MHCEVKTGTSRIYLREGTVGLEDVANCEPVTLGNNTKAIMASPLPGRSNQFVDKIGMMVKLGQTQVLERA